MHKIDEKNMVVLLLDRLKVLPCNYNFVHILCERGWTCVGDNWQSGGIKIFHGAGSRFHISGPHRMMCEAYREVGIRYSIYKDAHYGNV